MRLVSRAPHNTKTLLHSHNETLLTALKAKQGSRWAVGCRKPINELTGTMRQTAWRTPPNQKKPASHASVSSSPSSCYQAIASMLSTPRPTGAGFLLRAAALAPWLEWQWRPLQDQSLAGMDCCPLHRHRPLTPTSTKDTLQATNRPLALR
jgi:hypothetical protein